MHFVKVLLGFAQGKMYSKVCRECDRFLSFCPGGVYEYDVN